MKLGISYNIFDGEEMLPFALKNLRPFADFIVVVYQTTSNFGNPCHPKLLEKLEMLKTAGLIDKLFHYDPRLDKDKEGNLIWQNGAMNEIQKRDIGLKICRANGCDTYMTLDCDELYDHEQFKWAMQDFELGNYDTSFTNLLTYYKLPTMQLDPPETWYQPLFYKIKKDTKFQFFEDYPVFTDKTKMVSAGNVRVYKREEIQQYHYAYVRHNLDSKITNSSARSDKQSQISVKLHYETWQKKEDNALLIGLQHYNLIEVKNKFNIKL